MRRRSVWNDIYRSIRSNNRRARKKPSRRQGKGTWSSVADAVLFQPKKTGWVSIWRDSYQLERQLREIELGIYQNQQQTWLGTLKWKIRGAWHDLVDETKAIFTALLFHLLTLVLMVVFYALWFAALFWLIGVYLDW